jgi:hypothetical protein
LVRKLTGRDHLGDLDINGSYISLGNIKMAPEEIGWKGVHRIHLAQDRNLWALVYAVMELQFHKTQVMS